MERCTALLYVIDISLDEEPWTYFSILKEELVKFNPNLLNRSALIVANKIDLLEKNGDDVVEKFKQHTDVPVIPVSAKIGINLKQLLIELRRVYDKNKVD